MADLKVKLNIIQSNYCKSFLVFDVTGAYDVVNNPYGWTTTGFTNSLDVVASAKLIITSSNSTDIYEVPIDDFTSPGDDFDVSALFGTGFEVTASDIFGSGVTYIPDGYYVITLKITFDDLNTNSTGVSNEAFFCIVRCCVRGRATELKFPVCDYNKVKEWNHIQNMFTRMEYAACCGHVDRFLALLAYVHEWCNDGCGTIKMKNFIANDCC